MINKNYRSKILLAGFFIFILAVPQVFAQKNSAGADNFLKLDWLVGKWDRLEMKKGMRGEERWVFTSDGLYKGVGITTSGKDTLFIERLEIVNKDGTFSM